MSNVGWIKLYRQIQDTLLWRSKEPFDKRSAWLDLLMLANFSESESLFGNTTVNVQRGSLVTSESILMERWKWSKNKVRAFLKFLQNENMIEKESCRKWTRINIVNYSVYQDLQTTKEPQKNQQWTAKEPVMDCKRTTKEPQMDYDIRKKESNNIQEDKKERNINILDTDVSNCRTEDVQHIVDAWNDLKMFGITPIRKIVPQSKRHTLLMARIRQYGLDSVLEAIDNIRESDFLQGKHNGRDFQITFDWFIKPNNFPKVLEGNYSNKHGRQQSGMRYGNSRDEQFSNLMEQIRRDSENDD